MEGIKIRHGFMANENSTRIYVVDDEVTIGQLVGEVLNAAGYPTIVFTHPSRALAEFAAADPKPELLITDFNMPSMNGLELIQRCAALAPGLKCISISTGISEEDLAEYRVKPTKFLPK